MGSFCTTCSVSRGPGLTPLHLCFLSSCFRGFEAKCACLGPTSGFLHHHSPGGKETPYHVELGRWRPCPPWDSTGQSCGSSQWLLSMLPHLLQLCY